MKHFFTLLLSFIVCAGFAQQKKFITIWDTSLPGVTPSNQIEFPGRGNNYLIEWEKVDNAAINGTASGSNTFVLTFPEPGKYKLSILGGAFMGMNNVAGRDKRKIITIVQWGDNKWWSMERAFSGAEDLELEANDLLYLGAFNGSVAGMFAYCKKFKGAPSMKNWDMSTTVNMDSMFFGASQFNLELAGWKTYKVTSMRYLFGEATSFNQPIGGWVTTSLRFIDGIFYGASSFDQHITEWSVDNVVSMESAFEGAKSFNKHLNLWNTSNVVNMKRMFAGASSFNQGLNHWNVAKVENMAGMFDHALEFDQPLFSWNTAKVKDLSYIFRNAINFNQNLRAWNTSVVASFTGAFYGASMFNHSLGSWKLNAAQAIDSILIGTSIDVANYDYTLIGWGSQEVNRELVMNSKGLYYCNGATARKKLIEDFGWNIHSDLLNCNPTPVTFSQINATFKNDLLTVNWKTDTESNNDFFEVQFSVDGQKFVSLGRVDSKAMNGNSSTGLEYNFTYQWTHILWMGLPFILALYKVREHNNAKYKKWIISGVLILMMSFASCKKVNLTVQELPKQAIQVRVAQIDRDGSISYSKIVGVTIQK